MTDHMRRIREHMAVETKMLTLEAERARLFDHGGNRGSEAEHSILRWLRARFAPDYTVSSGEIIDSFDTNADKASRQQDGILHQNDADANRFLLPSGMRLVPIESVAAVIEVKLTLNKSEFDKADAAATETARLRYRVASGTLQLHMPKNVATPVDGDTVAKGLAASDARIDIYRPTFAVFAFGGVQEPETLADWLRGASTIGLVCCLETGCALRVSRQMNVSAVSGVEHALSSFAEHLAGSIRRRKALLEHIAVTFSDYTPESWLPYWDESRYHWATGYVPSEDQVQRREQLFASRPDLRR